ncbi:MAG: HAD family hydrolase [Planctomycetota bacterium]
MKRRVPFGRLKAVFLDAGNTLLQMNYSMVADFLARRGLSCGPQQVARAEAAARPGLSRFLAEGASTESDEPLTVYVRGWLLALVTESERETQLGRAMVEGIVEQAVSWIREPGSADRLWSQVFPGVPKALVTLGELGVKRVVVSNSDGLLQARLERVGLLRDLDGVLDSGTVGSEKPQPEIFHAALAMAGSTPEESVHVGDLYAVDVLGAWGVGIHAVLLDPYGDWQEECCILPDVSAVAERIQADRQRGAAP